MVLHWCLSDSKSPQVFRTLLGILADLSNAVVWIVSTYNLISKSSSHFINHLGIVPSVPITIGITVTFMFHSLFYFCSLARSRYSSLFSIFKIFSLWSTGTAKSTIRQVLSFFFLLSTRSGRLAEIRWSVCISKSQRRLWVSFSGTDSRLCLYHLFVWSNLNFLHNSQWTHSPIPSCLILYSLR